MFSFFFFFQAEDGIRDAQESRGLGDVYKRQVRLYPGVATPLAGVGPDDIDMVVVREGTEGPYAGAGGVLRRGTAHEVATEESLNTRYGVERVVRDAFARADSRPRRHLTLVHKTNVLTRAGDLWARTVDAVDYRPG